MSDEEKKRQRWAEFIKLCEELKHGRLEKVLIQDGYPVLVEHEFKATRLVKL